MFLNTIDLFNLVYTVALMILLKYITKVLNMKPFMLATDIG